MCCARSFLHTCNNIILTGTSHMHMHCTALYCTILYFTVCLHMVGLLCVYTNTASVCSSVCLFFLQTPTWLHFTSSTRSSFCACCGSLTTCHFLFQLQPPRRLWRHYRIALLGILITALVSSRWFVIAGWTHCIMNQCWNGSQCFSHNTKQQMLWSLIILVDLFNACIANWCSRYLVCIYRGIQWVLRVIIGSSRFSFTGFIL